MYLVYHLINGGVVKRSCSEQEAERLIAIGEASYDLIERVPKGLFKVWRKDDDVITLKEFQPSEKYLMRIEKNKSVRNI